jgi:hypothetical protein
MQNEIIIGKREAGLLIHDMKSLGGQGIQK